MYKGQECVYKANYAGGGIILEKLGWLRDLWGKRWHLSKIVKKDCGKIGRKMAEGEKTVRVQRVACDL